MSITVEYVRNVGQKVYEDFDRVEVNGVEAEVIAITQVTDTEAEILLRPIEAIKSLNSVSIFSKSGIKIYEKQTNINIQDIHNIELKISIGVTRRV